MPYRWGILVLAVSVVIPTRNRRTLLARALRTVLAQHDVNLEVVVVDEASEDGTADLVRGLSDPRVELVRHDAPKGVAAARNSGLARARAPWVAFLDDDDLWAPTKLALQLQAAANVEAGWVCVGSVVVDEALRIVSGTRPPPSHELPEILSFNLVPGVGSGPMVRTELARSVGGFDTGLSILADWDMWIRLFLRTPPAFVYHPLVGYLRHHRSMSHLNQGFPDEFDRMAAKHAPARQTWGVQLSRERWLRWAAAMHVRSGNRREAFRTYVYLARYYRDAKSLARAALGVLFPKLMMRYWRWNALRLLPPGWYEEGEAWLAPIREQLLAEDAATLSHPPQYRCLSTG